MADLVAQTLLKKFPEAFSLPPDFRDEEAVCVTRESIIQVLRFLYSNPDTEYTLLEDICGADYPGRQDRFEVVYHLYSLNVR